MSIKRSINLVVFVFILFSFSGCASFRGGKLPPITEWPPQGATKNESISIVVNGEGFINGKRMDTNTRFINTWRDQVIRAYKDSGLFSDVRTGLSETDLRAEVRIVDRGDANLALAFLTGLTLYVIPSKATDSFTIQSTLKDKEGNIIGEFEKSEDINFWQQLFLIFFTPFNSPNSVLKETLYDLNRATINEAHQKGVI